MSMFVYTGSMTRPSAFFPDARGEGIVVWRWDGSAHALERVQTVTDIVNPSWLAIDPTRRRLYATGELHDSTKGRVGIFEIDVQSGRLNLIGEHESAGSATCHLAVSDDGMTFAWVNYSTLPPGGKPDESVVLYQGASVLDARHQFAHTGSTPFRTGRQERSHAHCALFDTVRSRLLTTDLGLDALFSIPLDDDADMALELAFVFPPGSGPRHITARPDFGVFYVVHELLPRIDVLVAGGKGFELVQSVELGMRDVAQPAGIILSPDARHLFASVRGTNEIRGFAIRPDGRLALPQTIMPAARTPRDISFTCDGRHLLVAGQDGGVITSHLYDTELGRFADGTVIARTGSPTCVRCFETRKD